MDTLIMSLKAQDHTVSKTTQVFLLSEESDSKYFKLCGSRGNVFNNLNNLISGKAACLYI